MKTLNRLSALAGALVILGSVSSAHAQVNAKQKFRVRVPSNMTIASPSALVAITHDETSGNQTFAPQQWQVKANSIKGASISFSTDQVFTHTLDKTFKRDARLDVSIASSDGPAKWKLVVASDQTNYAASTPDEVATVQVASTRPGQATFDLKVTFITDTYTTLADGDYELTVTGTLTAN